MAPNYQLHLLSVCLLSWMCAVYFSCPASCLDTKGFAVKEEGVATVEVPSDLPASVCPEDDDTQGYIPRGSHQVVGGGPYFSDARTTLHPGTDKLRTPSSLSPQGHKTLAYAASGTHSTHRERSRNSGDSFGRTDLDPTSPSAVSKGNLSVTLHCNSTESQSQAAPPNRATVAGPPADAPNTSESRSAPRRPHPHIGNQPVSTALLSPQVLPVHGNHSVSTVAVILLQSTNLTLSDNETLNKARLTLVSKPAVKDGKSTRVNKDILHQTSKDFKHKFKQSDGIFTKPVKFAENRRYLQMGTFNSQESASVRAPRISMLASKKTAVLYTSGSVRQLLSINADPAIASHSDVPDNTATLTTHKHVLNTFVEQYMQDDQSTTKSSTKNVVNTTLTPLQRKTVKTLPVSFTELQTTSTVDHTQTRLTIAENVRLQTDPPVQIDAVAEKNSSKLRESKLLQHNQTSKTGFEQLKMSGNQINNFSKTELQPISNVSSILTQHNDTANTMNPKLILTAIYPANPRNKTGNSPSQLIPISESLAPELPSSKDIAKSDSGPDPSSGGVPLTVPEGGLPLPPPPGPISGDEPPPLVRPNSTLSRETLQQVRLSLSLTCTVLSITGVALNLASLLVFRRYPATTTTTLMALLLALETLCLVVNFPICVADIVYLEQQFFPLPLAYFRLCSELTLLVAMRRAIILLTAIMTLDRFLTSAFPLLVRESKFIRRPRLTVCLVLLATMAYSLADTLCRWQIVEMADPESNVTVGLILPTEEFRTNLGLLSFLVITNILCQYIPTLILVVANLGLLVFLILHKIRMREQDIRGATVKNRVRPIRSVSIVFAYSVVTLGLNLPLEIYMSRDVYSELDSWGEEELPEHQDLGLLPFVYSCVNVLSWSVDFFIYWSVSSRFRHNTKQLFGMAEDTGSQTQNTPAQ